MYLRETRRSNRDGSVVSYLQLAHNERQAHQRSVEAHLGGHGAGSDPAEVRGIAQEAAEKAEQGIVVPLVEVPEVKLAAHAHVERPTLPDLSENIAVPTSGLSKFMNHPWVYSTGAAIIAGLVILALTIWLT